MTIAYVCADQPVKGTATRKAAWEADLTNAIQWMDGMQMEDFESDWDDMCRWPGPPLDVTWIPDHTGPNSLASISLKIATSVEVPSERFFEITYAFKPPEQM